jgi:hypothetical protein
MNNEMPSYNSTDSDLYEWYKLSKNHRIVFNRNRKRILEKRGERVNFVIDAKCWVWVRKEKAK